MVTCFLIGVYIWFWRLCLKYGLVDEWVLWVAAIGLIIILGIGASR